MQAHTRYTIDDLRLPDGTWFSVDGMAEISAEMCGTYGDVHGWSVDAIYLGRVQGEQPIAIDDRHPLWRAIMQGLEARNDYIIDQLYEENGPFRSIDADRRAEYLAGVL